MAAKRHIFAKAIAERVLSMSLFIFLIVLQALTAALLVVVILLQKSEGGGLGVGGSPTGFMSARGAADFLSRATGVLASVFVGLSIVLAAIAVKSVSASSVDTTLNRTVVPAAPLAPADPLAQAAASGAAAAPAASPVPVAPADPLGSAAKK